jgi:hypothetical protein
MMQNYKIILHFINEFSNFVRLLVKNKKLQIIMGPIIKKIFTFLLLPVAIVALAYANFESVAVDVRYKQQDKPSREAVAIQRLKDIRTLQEAYKNVKGYYSSTIDSLQIFYNEGAMKVVLQVGSMDDSLAVANTTVLKKKLKAQGVKDKDMPARLKEEFEKSNGELKLVFAVESDVPVRDTLFNHRDDFCVDSLAFIPFSGGDSIMLRAEVREVSGVKVPLFEAKIPFASLLKGLNEQLVVNTIAERHDLELYPGLKVGDVEKPNNNAGNWE